MYVNIFLIEGGLCFYGFMFECFYGLWFMVYGLWSHCCNIPYSIFSGALESHADLLLSYR